MAEAALKMKLSYEDYLSIEAEHDQKHEFLDGEVFAMAGGTPTHAALKTSLTGMVWSQLGAGPCRPFDADLKIRVPATGLATYPDLSVICGPLERDAEDRNAATNPVLLVEVLSPTTAAWDRGEKFAHYQQLPSLRHYLLVSQDRPAIEHFARQADGSWRYTRHLDGDTLHLPDLGLTLRVSEVYQNLPAPDEG